MPHRQRRSGPVSIKNDQEETSLPRISISKAALSESLHKPIPAIRRAVSSEDSYDWPQDTDRAANTDHNTRWYNPADDYKTLDNVTYSLHITFEGQEVSNNYNKVSIHPKNPPNHKDIASMAEGCVKAQLGHTALVGKSLSFRLGECAITYEGCDNSLGHRHTQALSTDADWNYLYSVLENPWTSSGSNGIHLDIHYEYCGLLIERVGEGKFAKAKRTEIYNLSKTAFDGRRYLPRSDLLKVASKDMVREVITDDPTIQPMEKETFILKVCERAPKLLTMCVLAQMQMRCLKVLLEKGQDDNTTPLKEEHRCHQGCAQDFDDLLRWYEGLNAATFLRPGEHQKLRDKRVLPVHYHPKEEDQMAKRTEGPKAECEEENESDEEDKSSDKTKAWCGSGAHSKVYRVRLDPAHHNLTKVSEFNCSCMALVSRKILNLLNPTHPPR